MSEWRPYRLALLATSPVLTGEAKRAGWAYTKSLEFGRESHETQAPLSAHCVRHFPRIGGGS